MVTEYAQVQPSRGIIQGYVDRSIVDVEFRYEGIQFRHCFIIKDRGDVDLIKD